MMRQCDINKWDVSTKEGRWELEKWLMTKLGWTHEAGPNKNWFLYYHDDGLVSFWTMRQYPGWIYTGDGMNWWINWAVKKKGWKVLMGFSKDGPWCEIQENWVPIGYTKVWEADSLPVSAALALARALKEMED